MFKWKMVVCKKGRMFGRGGGGADSIISATEHNRENELLKHKGSDTLKLAMCFQSRSSGSFHALLPNAPENNPTVFFPSLLEMT